MNASAGLISREKALSLGKIPGWLWLGAGIYVLFLIVGSSLLRDSDTYWQIAVGQGILDHAAWPRVDIYSFTKAGEPWISIFLARAGPVCIELQSGRLDRTDRPCVGAIAATFALLAYILGRRIPSTYAVLVALAALVLSAPHFLARPHVLALPVMVAWANGLMSRKRERGRLRHCGCCR